MKILMSQNPYSGAKGNHQWSYVLRKFVTACISSQLPTEKNQI